MLNIGFIEEIIFRGTLFPSLQKAMSLNKAAVISALIFGVLHGTSFDTVIGAAGIGITIFLSKTKDYLAVKNTVVLKNKKAKFLKNYFKTASIIHITYAVLNIVVAFFADFMVLGIIPLAIHMIVSSWILMNMKARLSVSKKEQHVVEFWATSEIGSFIVAFLSVIVATMIAAVR